MFILLLRSFYKINNFSFNQLQEVFGKISLCTNEKFSTKFKILQSFMFQSNLIDNAYSKLINFAQLVIFLSIYFIYFFFFDSSLILG